MSAEHGHGHGGEDTAPFVGELAEHAAPVFEILGKILALGILYEPNHGGGHGGGH